MTSDGSEVFDTVEPYARQLVGKNGLIWEGFLLVNGSFIVFSMFICKIPKGDYITQDTY